MAKFCGKCGSRLDDKGKCPNCKTEESKLFSLNTVKQKPWIGIVAIVLVLAIVVGTISIISVCFRKDDPKIDNLQLPIVGKFTDKKITDGQSAIQAVQEVADDLGLENAAEELTVKREDTVGELTYYRLQQNYKGIPVYGSDFVVIADENGEAKGVTGNANDINDSISLTPTVTQEQVEESIRAYFGEETEISVPKLSDDMLTIYDNDDINSTTLIYKIPILFNRFPYFAFVDAINASTINMLSLSFYEDTTEHTDYDDKKIRVVNLSGNNWENWKNYIGSPVDKDIATNLKNYAHTTYDFFDQVLEYQSFSGNGQGAVTLVYDCIWEFHHKDDYQLTMSFADNAMANTDDETEKHVVLCFGKEGDFKNLETLAHEYTHAVEHLISGMEYSGESGAIMEGYSDVFAEFIQVWNIDTTLNTECDWIHGDRNLKKPLQSGNPNYYNGTNFKSTKNKGVDEYGMAKNDNGHVHNNSTVISHIAYLMTQVNEIGTSLTIKEVANLWFSTLYTLPATCDFDAFRQNMLMVANSINYSNDKISHIESVFDAVGIDGLAKDTATAYEEYSKNPTLQVYGLKMEIYDDYTIDIIKDSWFDRSENRHIAVSDTNPVSLEMTAGTFTITIRDRKDKTKIVTKNIRIVNDGDADKTIKFATDFGNNTDVPDAVTSDERDIVLVLDNSGSMSGTPIQETRKASENFVKTVLQQDASIGIVAFESEAHMLSNFSMDEAQLMSALGNLYANGGTNTLAGLTMAGEMLEQSSAKKKIIVLMSDGRPSNSQSELAEYAKELRKKDIIIYSLGFFSDVSDKASAQSIMESIADEGRHYEVADADSLVYFFGDIADQISGQPYIFIKIACPVEVTVEYDGEVLCSEADNLSTRTSFGSLTFEERTDGERVKVLRLKQGTKYDIRIEGTDEGRMNYTIGLMDKNGEYSDIRKFYNVKITDKTLIQTVASESRNTVLEVDEDGDGKFDVQYKAGENSRGEIVKTNHAVWVIPSIILILIAVGALIVLKKKNILIKKG